MCAMGANFSPRLRPLDICPSPTFVRLEAPEPSPSRASWKNQAVLPGHEIQGVCSRVRGGLLSGTQNGELLRPGVE